MKPQFDDYPKGAQQLMLTAERLFGKRGVDGVSIRQLLMAAGQRNKSAVQHYFGSKQGLVEAVYEMRMPALDRARRQALEVLSTTERGNYKKLLAALFLPLLSVMDDQALEAYSEFNLRTLHLAERSFFGAAAASPVATDILKRVQDCFSALPIYVFEARIRLAIGVFLDGVGEWRYFSTLEHNPYASHEVFWNDVLQNVIRVIDAPFPPRIAFPITAAAPAVKRTRAARTKSAVAQEEMPAKAARTLRQ
ncbi:MAG: TetR/AcrR family transcriptional regulator [Verrucomicrobiaceae bacterium]|nr:TetR/AcrR family transcriptional regulator [Verrucomicrobiaceae bacterium]